MPRCDGWFGQLGRPSHSVQYKSRANQRKSRREDLEREDWGEIDLWAANTLIWLTFEGEIPACSNASFIWQKTKPVYAANSWAA